MPLIDGIHHKNTVKGDVNGVGQSGIRHTSDVVGDYNFTGQKGEKNENTTKGSNITIT
ncbi:hypothetical protein M426DRAFT_17920 [Hypoxylon sp. CI-4A]|nr:hypothetical protein M426DRAFT_17920 [Hypoxylon sp. CI-4A]